MTLKADTLASRDSRGFMLLEVLVAFVIATLALGVIIRVAVETLRASRIAARYEQATVRAQSHLTEAVEGGSLIPGKWEGEDGSTYHWRLQVAPTWDVAQRPASGPTAGEVLYAVSVWVSWQEDGSTRVVHLDTEHIGPAPRTP
jgi:general secretion pathway protein I